MKAVLVTFITIISLYGYANKKPDNTEINKRDQRASEKTADKHGTSEKDVKISSQLRQALVKDSSLSTYAQNIKIITVNGEVTLKGPVRTAVEQKALVNKAKNVSGVTRVLNETDVVKE